VKNFCAIQLWDITPHCQYDIFSHTDFWQMDKNTRHSRKIKKLKRQWSIAKTAEITFRFWMLFWIAAVLVWLPHASNFYLKPTVWEVLVILHKYSATPKAKTDTRCMHLPSFLIGIVNTVTFDQLICTQHQKTTKTTPQTNYQNVNNYR